MNGSIHLRLRPLKLAFVVDPNDKKSLREAIQINTFLWGGTFNPIIPGYKRLPERWDDKPFRSETASNVFNGYLDAFDPDFIVPMGRWSNEKEIFGNRNVIKDAEILEHFDNEHTACYGIGLFEVLTHLYEKEFKFIRKNPLELTLPDCGKNFDILWSSIFGKLPKNIDDVFIKKFKAPLGINESKCTFENYFEFLKRGNLFFKRMSRLFIESTRAYSWGHEAYLFFFDANNVLDIIDYWNLCSIGCSVMPVPQQASEIESVRKAAIRFINKNYFPDRNNPQLYHMTNFLKGRSTSKTDFEVLADYLTARCHDQQKGSKFVIQTWYPRMWNIWAREHDNAECCELEAGSRHFDLAQTSDTLVFRTFAPEFMEKHISTATPRFVNEVELRMFGNKEPIAEIIPESNEMEYRIKGLYGFNEWRFSKKGLVYLAQYDDSTVYLNPPKAEDVFFEWLKSKNWRVASSVPGRLAKQITIQLGGVNGLELLANRPLLNIFKEMENGKPKSESDLRRAIEKVAEKQKINRGGDEVLSSLIKRQIIQQGMEIQCAFCQQRSWYSIDNVSYSIKCLNCSQYFPFPTNPSKNIKWSFKTIGPFAIPDRCQGVYSVLLTLRFFSHHISSTTTPAFSFLAEKGNTNIEADMGMFFQESKHIPSRIELIFAECKTDNNFTKSDIDRLKSLAAHFQGSVLVIATLRDSFGEKEKAMIRPLVNKCRRYLRDERPYNPVLILTGIELYSHFGPPYCWEDAGGRFAKFAKNYRGWNKLMDLCDTTQQLHLDMESWHTWLRKKWQKRAKSRSKPK